MSQATSTTTLTNTAVLLCLPTELRLAIWEHLLVQRQSPPTSQSSRQQKQDQGFCANILLTCKQINVEGTPILYGENTFLAHRSLLSSLPCFLVGSPAKKITLPPVKHWRVAQMIRKFHLVVRLDTDPGFTKSTATESFSGIDVLSIEVFQAMFGSCDFTVLQLFEGIRRVGRASVKGSVGDGKYARWLEQSMMSKDGIEEYGEQYVGGLPSWDAWTKGNR